MCLKIVSEVRKYENCTPYLECFQIQMYLFYIPNQNNAIYVLGVPSLHNKHVVLFMFTIFYLKQKI